MAKSLVDKKVNRAVRRLNKELQKDVFGDRFMARQVRKSRGEDGVMYYLYEFLDKECPERNYMYHGWLSEFSVLRMNTIWMEMNNFIIHSDFWAKYYDKHPRVNETSE